MSQQRKLLKLTDELQALVSAGDLPIRVGRNIAGLPAEEQKAAWAAEVGRRAESKALPRARATNQSAPSRTQESIPQPDPVTKPDPQLQPNPDRFTAVNQNGGQGGDQLLDKQQLAVPEPRAVAQQPPPQTAPALEAAPGGEQPVWKMPWHDGAAVADIARLKMSPAELDRLRERLDAPAPAQPAPDLA